MLGGIAFLALTALGITMALSIPGLFNTSQVLPSHIVVAIATFCAITTTFYIRFAIGQRRRFTSIYFLFLILTLVLGITAAHFGTMLAMHR